MKRKDSLLSWSYQNDNKVQEQDHSNPTSVTPVFHQAISAPGLSFNLPAHQSNQRSFPIYRHKLPHSSLFISVRTNVIARQTRLTLYTVDRCFLPLHARRADLGTSDDFPPFQPPSAGAAGFSSRWQRRRRLLPAPQQRQTGQSTSPTALRAESITFHRTTTNEASNRRIFFHLH